MHQFWPIVRKGVSRPRSGRKIKLKENLEKQFFYPFSAFLTSNQQTCTFKTPNVGFRNAEFDANFESVEKIAKNIPKKG